MDIAEKVLTGVVQVMSVLASNCTPSVLKKTHLLP